MLNFIPFVTFVVVFAATIARGLVLRRRTGDNVWAFAGASGLQRATSVVFALSIGLLALTSVRTTGRLASVFTAVRRQNIWLNSRLRLAECGPRLGVDVRRRACGVASGDVRWSVA